MEKPRLFWKIFGVRKSDLFVVVVAVLLFLLTIPQITYASFANSLNDEETLMNRNDTGIVLLDRKNRPFFTFYQGRIKTRVPLDQISSNTQTAIVAAEDKRFYQHRGFSIEAIARSLVKDFNNGSLDYGGSTITQQLVKNVLLNPQKSFLRKYQEIALAREIEHRYSKDEILTMYLNSVYFGEGAFGIEEAAKIYFNKPAKELNLAESAMLAGVLPAPSRFSPLSGDFNQAKVRQQYVLDQMVEIGAITPKQAATAAKEELQFNQNPENLNQVGVHFALLARDELVKKYGEEAVARSGFTVKTSLDLDYQKYAEEVVKDQVKKLAVNGVTNAATVVMDPQTGEILAMVGSYDWQDEKFGKVNVALSSRQPGSSFKPIYYSLALESGEITPATILQDQPTTFPINYKPKDYDGKYRGPVTVRRALANSLNIPSVQVLSQVGVETALNQAQKYGLTTLQDPSQYGLSLALGAGEVQLLEMTEAYAVFANQGVKNSPVTVLEIRDKWNQDLYTFQPDPQPVLNPGAAFLISSILSDTKTRQEMFGNALDLPITAAVKTGTTENYRDAWTLGYTPNLVVGVWVGNNDGRPMDNVAGSLGAAPIWKSLMLKFSPTTSNFTPPDNISQYNCKISRQVQKTTKDSDGKEKKETKTEDINYQEYFLIGTAPSYCKPTNQPTITPTPLPSLIPTPSTSITNPPTERPLLPQDRPTPTLLPPEPTSTPTPKPTFTPTPTPTTSSTSNSSSELVITQTSP